MSVLSLHQAPAPLDPRSAAGFTLVELLVSMVLGLIITFVAFAFLDLTLNDVSRTTERVHVDQLGRIAMEKIMLELDSACVAPSVEPVLVGSGPTVLRFISKSGEEAALSPVEMHEITYTAPIGVTPGTLIEKSWKSIGGGGGSPPKYTFNEAGAHTERRLLTGVRQSLDETTKLPIPVFRYYRYYRELDFEPAYGTLNPKELSETAVKNEPGRVVKVTVNFTVTREGGETGQFAKTLVPLEDSAIFRLVPSSETASSLNAPCAGT